MRATLKTGSAIALLALSGCISREYTPPLPAAPPALEFEIAAPREKVWAALEELVEREAGLAARLIDDAGRVEIRFGPIDPAPWVDCGRGKVDSREVHFEGPVAMYLRDHAEGQLLGDVDIRIFRLETGNTRVRYLVQYRLAANASGSRAEGQTVRAQNYSWVFNSKGSATIHPKHRLGSSGNPITCRPSYDLEQAIEGALEAAGAS